MNFKRISLIAFLVLPLPAADLFEATVQPLLISRCGGCHGAQAKFDITSADGFARAQVVVPGKPEESKLFQFVSSGAMPKSGQKLSAAELSAVRQWILDGAVYPRQRPVFWAFRSPVKPAGTHSIDSFIQAKLGAKGVQPSPKADHRTLIRRLHFDLTGLPPRAEDLDRTYAETVERLLASPHYGERWGRHWLDIVRFGETDGGEHNNDRPFAWPYRDYVIESLNADKPYNQFIREQIAGDILGPHDPKMVAATGFLVAGPWDSVSAELNKDKNMLATARMDELDDIVTTTFNTFQGLTVNCARCHDHKFDPIPTRDYYKLTSVFSGVGFGTRKVATPEAEAEYEEKSKPVRQRLDEARRAVGAIDDPVRTAILREKLILFDKAREKEPLRIPLNPVWNRNVFQPVTASRFRLTVTAHQGKLPKIDRLQLLPGGPELIDWKGAVKASNDAPVFVEMTMTTPVTVAELLWSTDARNGASDGQPSVYRIEAQTTDGKWTLLCSSLDHEGRVEVAMPVVTDEELLERLKPEQRAERERLITARTRIESELKSIPEPPRIHAAKPREIAKSYLLERGSVTRPGDEVHPGALTAIKQLAAEFELSEPASDKDRRLALANWITDERNPLTARVIVNRVWAGHFGAGIVNTPSDFGLNGDRPSHPELLDWLAVSFIENGWSLKWLHRQILNSHVYQQSTAMNEKAHAVDADNRLLWRMPLKRMDAETLRDAILFSSGKLNLEGRGGPSFALQKNGGKGSYIYQALDHDGPEVWRRSVYRYVVRGGERIFLDSFDCPDPSVATPQRTVSNTPVQALTLLNNDFVLRHAAFLAERAAGDIERVYRILFQRAPSAKEREAGELFVKQHGMAVYCRVLLNTNEFVYVP
jgi:hypothetical protein